MALPADFSKIFGSTATGGLTPIGDVNYAKGWEFVGSNPPTKNDFSYLQNLSDMKSQWLYANKLQRTDPFGDIKSDGEGAVSAARSNLGLGTAATKNVGTGAGQIPDMSSFPSGANYFKMPGGKIVQFGTISFATGVNQVVVNYPVAFPSAVRSIVLTWSDASGASGASSIGLWYAVVRKTHEVPLNQFIAWMSGAGGFNLSYIAIGE